MPDLDTLNVIRLDELERHQCGVVHHVDASEADMARLMAMGVCGGRTIELIRTGDPLVLKVFGSRIGVSARLACKVIVRPCGPRSDLVSLGGSHALL
jgi:Fe2+ transport system protein FeoA